MVLPQGWHKPYPVGQRIMYLENAELIPATIVDSWTTTTKNGSKGPQPRGSTTSDVVHWLKVRVKRERKPRIILALRIREFDWIEVT